MKTLIIICQRVKIIYLRFRCNQAKRTYRRLMRQKARSISLHLRTCKQFPVYKAFLILLPIAEMHEIRFDNQEITFPVNPDVNELIGGALPTRVLLYRNIISIRELNGFMWLISRSGHVYGFSTTTTERICDYMSHDVGIITLPKWWVKLITGLSGRFL